MCGQSWCLRPRPAATPSAGGAPQGPPGVMIMTSIRVGCFVVAVVVFAQGGGWLTAIPAVGAIVIPYFAVVFANGGREPSSTRGFRAYEPNLPTVYHPPGGDSADEDAGGQTD